MLNVLMMSALALANPEDSLAAKGDAFWFTASALDDESNVLNVQWSQAMREQAQDYVQVTGLFSDAPKATDATPFMLFLQKDMVEAFRQQFCDESRCQAAITSQFQYGQDKEMTMRFVVYHNPANKPFQHRFLATNAATTYTRTLQQVASTAGELNLPVPGVEKATSIVGDFTTIGQNLVGDNLHSF
jgi:hypothetical protein